MQLPLAIEPPSADEAEGCIQCQQGSKLVLFITGLCHYGCDYCPLDEARRNVDLMYANERRTTELDDVIEEARSMRATGTGITGGDPLYAFERVLEACTRLKAEFGPGHHIHLYTSLKLTPDKAEQLAAAGLDEIRFHLLDLDLHAYSSSLAAASAAGITTGIELPAAPDEAEALFALIEDLREQPIDFLNLNELEITVGNADNMEVRGFNLAAGMTYAADGSATLALQLRQRVEAAAAGAPDPLTDEVHAPYGFHLKFCTAAYKDAGQLRRRFLRRGETMLQPHEILTDDGTVVVGALYSAPEHQAEDAAELTAVLGLPDGWVVPDAANRRLELPLWVAEEIAHEVDAPVAVVEVHPTSERLEVELVWLNALRP